MLTIPTSFGVACRYVPRSNSPRRRSTLEIKNESTKPTVGYRRLQGQARIKSMLSNEGSRVRTESDNIQGKWISSTVTTLLLC